jgi:hypothetical protein
MELSENIQILFLKKHVPHVTLANGQMLLTEDVAARWKHKEKEWRIYIEKNFRWKGVTIPKFIWMLVGYKPLDNMLSSALWHTYIYINKGNVYNYITNKFEHISRKHCDQLFYTHMRKCGVSPKDAKRIYVANRIFGILYWFDNTLLNKLKK